MSDPIRIGGFFSSFDTEAVIARLTEVRQRPLFALEDKQALMTARKTAVGSLVTQFTTLLSRVNTLLTPTSVSGKSATVSGSGVSAAASPNAALGSFNVAVAKLATGTTATGTHLSAGVDSVSILDNANFGTKVTAGTFTIKSSAGGSATITVDPATQSLDDIIGLINAETGTTGITATLENDAYGRPNILRLTSSMGDVQLGTGADTSNFLSATNLIAAPGTTARESTLPIARLNLNAKMSDAGWLTGAPAAGDHSFTINGVTIAYNAANDTLNDVLTRINASSAGVTATYDPATDKIRLTQGKLGSLAITMADDGAGGDFLAKTGILAASQALGSNAEYSVDGGATQYSASNTVALANGVTLTLTGLTGGTPATVSVTQDAGSAVSALKSFVADFNALMTSLNDLTKGDKSRPGLFSGDSAILSLRSQLRAMISGQGINVTGKFSDLSSLGLSFGAVGSAPGTTNTLQFDEAKFKDALASEPLSVQNALSTFGMTASLVAGGTGSIASIDGTYTGSRPGSYAITDDGAGNLTVVFTPTDGTAAITTTGAIAAGGTNATLIPGVTLTAGAVLAAGTNTVQVSTSSASVVRRIKEFLEGQVGGAGRLAKRQDEFTRVSDDIGKRMQRIQDSIDKEMALMRRKFIAMEQAQARASSIMTALQQANAQLAAMQNQR
jgi:flagellar hook-associated protein 2